MSGYKKPVCYAKIDVDMFSKPCRMSLSKRTPEQYEMTSIEIATAELIEFLKANPIKRNTSGTMNGNARNAVLKKWAKRFNDNNEGVYGGVIAAHIIDNN